MAPLQPETASRYFFFTALFNIVIAAGVTAPVLLPQLGLPLVLQVWPGTWMFVAYFSFLIVGVLGMFVWSTAYYMVPRLFGKDRLNKLLTWAHLLLFEVGV